MRITRNDPRRAHLHDYVLVDAQTGRDLAAFDTQAEAMAYAVEHLRGRVTVLSIVHPEGCTCQPGQLVYPSGRAGAGAVGVN